MLTRFERLDSLLDRHIGVLGADLVPYRNHNYRVVNFCTELLGDREPETLQKLSIAAAFHDLGIWTDGTFDYLDPSESRALAYLQEIGCAEWAPEISAMVQEHHRIRGARAGGALAEAFRKADWIDVSLGLLRFGLPGDFVHQVRTVFPNAGFHRRLVQLSLRQLLRKPWNPMPMMKW
ncbi:MAG: hypothetical protein ACT4PZ_20415 [Panacagrimonas sp.]